MKGAWKGILASFFFFQSALTPVSAQEEPSWDWFGYDWLGEYGGNVYDDDGVCRGRVHWLDYNEIIAISLVSIPAYNARYSRLRGFGLGNEWTGRYYRDDTPAYSIPMRWTFVPAGDLAWIEFRYELQFESGPPVPIHLTGWLRRRW